MKGLGSLLLGVTLLCCRAGTGTHPGAPELAARGRIESIGDESTEGANGAEASTPEQSTASAAAAPQAPPGGAAGAPSRNGGQRLRVFFSGHSLLDNPMPDWVELIAQSRGNSLAWQQQIVLGSPIRVRTKGDDPSAQGFDGYRLGKNDAGGSIDVLAELANPTRLAPGESYGHLVITERSDFLGTVKWEDTVRYLRHFHDQLVQHEPSARSHLYQCWPAIDAATAAQWIAYVRQELFAWQCVAAKVNRTLEAEGRRDRVDVIPGGIALAQLVESALAGSVPGIVGTPAQRLAMIFSDGAHLTPLGIYLLSSVHYAALFAESPVGAVGPPTVPAELLPELQRIAWEALSRGGETPRDPTLSDCRRKMAREVCPAYHRFRQQPEKVSACDFWLSDESPFAK